MAYLNKHPKSRFWSAVFRDVTGKQVRCSTKIEAYPAGSDSKERARLALENRRKAQEVADAFERASRGELKKESEIREHFARLVELAGGPRLAEPTAQDFLWKWVEDSERAGKPDTTLKRYKQVTREFCAHLEEKALAPVSHVTPDDVKEYLTRLTEKGLAPKTVGNALKVLRIPFAEAVRLGSLKLNPALAVRPPEGFSVERRAFTPSEVQSLFSACSGFDHGGQWLTALHLGYYAAMRLGDATGLTWGAVDFTNRAIVFCPEKTRRKGRKIEIPMHPALERHLLALTAPDDPDAPITPDLVTKAGERPKLSKQFSRLLIRAGVDNPQERSHARQGTGGKMVSTKSFHSLRHSLTSHLAGAGVSPELRMKITGHTDARVHAGYTHLERETLRDALERLPT